MLEIKSLPNFQYLTLDSALDNLADKDLVTDLLLLLHERLKDDWVAFNQFFYEDKLNQANGLMHSIKGIVPMFSDNDTTIQIKQLEEGLRMAGKSADVVMLHLKLDARMQALISELNQWHALFEKSSSTKF